MALDVNDTNNSIAVKFSSFEILLLNRNFRIDFTKVALLNDQDSLLGRDLHVTSSRLIGLRQERFDKLCLRWIIPLL